MSELPGEEEVSDIRVQKDEDDHYSRELRFFELRIHGELLPTAYQSMLVRDPIDSVPHLPNPRFHPLKDAVRLPYGWSLKKEGDT